MCGVTAGSRDGGRSTIEKLTRGACAEISFDDDVVGVAGRARPKISHVLYSINELDLT